MSFFSSLRLGAAPSDAIELANQILDKSDAKQTLSFEDELNQAKAYYFLGLYNQKNKESHFANAREITHAAILKKPDSPAAIMWWVAVEGEYNLITSKLRALNAIPKMEAQLKRLLKLNPSFFHYTADRALGVLYYRAPSFISVGDNKKARAHLEKALSHDPMFPGNQIYMADFLLNQGEKKKARQIAHQVKNSKNLAKYPLYQPLWIKIAEKIINKTNP